MELKINFEQTSSGVLNPEDLHFFYYDIGLETLTNAPTIYDWDEKIQSYIDSMQITIEPVNGIIISEFEEDKMFFFQHENETKAESFFRHLRNAFAHYNIRRDGDYLFCKDIDPQDSSITMIGCIKGDFLKELHFRFIDQRTSVGEKY